MSKPIRISDLVAMKQQHEKIAMLTAYDASFCRLMNAEGIDSILVGDSLGNVIQGRDTTVAVTVNDIAYHLENVARSNDRAFLIGDMPFMSYYDLPTAMANSKHLMQAGASMVKMEGGQELTDIITHLSYAGTPVCAHLGLQPQSVNVLGGFKVQGREQSRSEQIIDDAKALAAAGAQMLVLECVPRKLAKTLTELLTIPVIGIGAGCDTDGQVLVIYDMLGLGGHYLPKFAKNFLTGNESISKAIKQYINEVKHGDFPAAEHGFD